jgi:hypothetical protein
MFALFFPPAATGWHHTIEDNGLLPDEPAVRLEGGWPHTEARL